MVAFPGDLCWSGCLEHYKVRRESGWNDRRELAIESLAQEIRERAQKNHRPSEVRVAGKFARPVVG